MTVTESERLGLYAAVLAEPDDDSIRLVFSDWLYENGEPKRAEFIRVQLEMAKWTACVCGPTATGRYVCKVCCLRRRERELLERHWVEWLTPFPLLPMLRHDPRSRFAEGHCFPEYRRGFVAAVTLTAEDWLKHVDSLLWRPEKPCRECLGAMWLVRTLWLVRTSTPGSDWMEKCHACNGTGKRPMPTTAQPVEEVTLTTPIHRFGEGTSGNRVISIVGQDYGYQVVNGATVPEQVQHLLNARWPQIKPENWHLPDA